MPLVLLAGFLASGACGDDMKNLRQSTPDGGGALADAGSPDAALPVCVEQSGHACTWLGIPGQVGFNGDGHHRLATEIYWSMALIFAPDGTPWFVDFNNFLVRKVLPDQTVQSVVGWTSPVFPGDGDSANPTLEKSADGDDCANVQLNHPTDFAIAPDDRILLMAWHNHKLRAIDPTSNKCRILAGGGAGFAGDGGLAASALFKQPSHLRIDENGNLYILDQQNQRIRRIDGVTGNITTIAGNGTAGYAGDGVTMGATAANFKFEVGSNPEPSGGLAYKDNKLYIADALNNRIRVLDMSTSPGTLSLVAGDGTKGYAGDDGPAVDAELANPKGMEFGPDGDLYIADTDNSRIRAINLTTGMIRTVAGTGELGLDDNDGRLATDTMLARPFAVQFDPDGNLYIMDTINSRILKVTK